MPTDLPWLRHVTSLRCIMSSKPFHVWMISMVRSAERRIVHLNEVCGS